MSATGTKGGTALIPGASAGIGAVYAAATVASPLAARNAIVSGPILPELLRLTLPNLAAMLVVALVAIFETIYVGILGTTPLAAIALVFPLIMLMQMLSAGAMGGGVSSAISRALGAGDLARAEALALHAVVIGAAAGLAFSSIFVAFGAPILRALGGSGAVLGESLVYANIALAGAILTWLVNTFAPFCAAPAICGSPRSRCSPRRDCKLCSAAAWASALDRSRALASRASPQV
jgi:Na+-driven multidrug efflux pump